METKACAGCASRCVKAKLASPLVHSALSAPAHRQVANLFGGGVDKLPLDEREAARAVAIFNRMRLADVIGQPSMGEAAGEWFRDIVRAVFGSLDRRAGIRRVADVFVLVPKKKSIKKSRTTFVLLKATLVHKI